MKARQERRFTQEHRALLGNTRLIGVLIAVFERKEVTSCYFYSYVFLTFIWTSTHFQIMLNVIFPYYSTYNSSLIYFLLYSFNLCFGLCNFQFSELPQSSSFFFLVFQRPYRSKVIQLMLPVMSFLVQCVTSVFKSLFFLVIQASGGCRGNKSSTQITWAQQFTFPRLSLVITHRPSWEEDKQIDGPSNLNPNKGSSQCHMAGRLDFNTIKISVRKKVTPYRVSVHKLVIS